MTLNKREKEHACNVARSWRSLNDRIRELSIEQIDYLIQRENKAGQELRRKTIIRRLSERRNALLTHAVRTEI